MTLSPPAPSRTRPKSRKQSVVPLYRAGVTTDRIAKLTHLSRRRVTAIVRESVVQGLEEAGTDGVRLQLFADLEEIKDSFQRRLFFSCDVSPRERRQLINGIVRIVHEQALLIGAHAPKQVAVTNEQPVRNEQAEEKARGVVEFMRLADKIAASGYGSGRAPMDADTDLLLEGEGSETPEKPELLRQYEAGELQYQPDEMDEVPEPRRPVRDRLREQARRRKAQDDDDDDD